MTDLFEIKEREAFGVTEDGVEYVNLQAVYENCRNVNWSGWQRAYEIIKAVEDAGSVSRNYPDSPLSHLLNFTNNYLLERKICSLYKLKFLDDTHDKLLKTCGKNIPDFVDDEGRTYELKTGKSLGGLKDIHNWRNADRKLFYSALDNSLYIISKDGLSFRKIDTFVAPYVNIKAFRLDLEKDIMRRIKK